MADIFERLSGQYVGIRGYAVELGKWYARAKQLLAPIIDNPLFDRLVLVLILVNATTLGLETSDVVMARVGGLLHAIDQIIILVFVFELTARMIVRGKAFWSDGWSIFDFLVVAITILPFANNISVLRALRTIRALRVISAIPSMRRVVNGLFAALPGMGSIVMLLGIIFYVFSVMATNMFGTEFSKQFGDVGSSAFTLFQVMSLDGWAGDVVRPLMARYPYAWMFFVPFILLTSFTVLNLFIGIIVDAMQQQHYERLGKTDLLAAKRMGKLEGLFGSEKSSGMAEPSRPAEPRPDPRFDTMMEELRHLKDEIRSMASAGNALVAAARDKAMIEPGPKDAG